MLKPSSLQCTPRSVRVVSTAVKHTTDQKRDVRASVARVQSFGAKPMQRFTAPASSNGTATRQTTTTIEPVQREDKQAGVSNSPMPDEALDRFDFWSHWWPVVPVYEIDTTSPMPVDLLGMRLVVWTDSKGEWHCFRDLCPHRLAPLSEGMVMNDNLMCAYHGWEFGKSGACVKVPQIEDPKAASVATRSARSCVDVFPVKVVHGLLWVYPQPGRAGAEAAAASPVPAVPALVEADASPETSTFKTGHWSFRDFPMRWETLVENVVDASHVCFAHHGTPGVRRENMANGRCTVVPQGEAGADLTSQGGFTIAREAMGTTSAAEYQFSPPGGLVSYRNPFSESHFYSIPTKPGWSRLLMCMVFRRDAQVPLPLRVISSLVERWPVLEHLLIRLDLTDGDVYMLHSAERELIARGNRPSSYYMPANQDLPVVMLRKWLARHAGTIPTCTPEDDARMPPLMTKEQTLDRWTQHTSKCQTCQRALHTLNRVQLGAGVVGLVALLATCAALGSGVPVLSPAPVLGTLSLAVCAATVLGLQGVRQKFYYVPFVYARK